MAVTLADDGLAVDLVGLAAGFELAIVASETHRATLVGDVLLVLHDVDDGILGGVVHLGAVGLIPSEDIACELDDRHLHTEADADEGDIVLAGVAGGDNLALRAAVAEARGYDDAMEIAELLGDILVRDILGVDKLDFCLGSRHRPRRPTA